MQQATAARGAAGEADRGREARCSAKVEAFRSQKEVIKAQYSAAEAQVRIGEAATGIGEQMADIGLAIQRAKDKTEQMQARASGDRRADHLRARSRTSPPTRRSSTASWRDRVAVAGRRGARADEGRARLGRASKKELERSDRPAAWARASSRSTTRSRTRLNELDEQAEQAVDAGDRERLARAPGADGRGRADERRAARRTRTCRRPTRSSRRRTCRSRKRAELLGGRGPDPGPPGRLSDRYRFTRARPTHWVGSEVPPAARCERTEARRACLSRDRAEIVPTSKVC